MTAAASPAPPVIVAEGIESREQAEAAAELGLAQGQGFYFGKPVEPEEALVTVSDGPSAVPW